MRIFGFAFFLSVLGSHSVAQSQTLDISVIRAVGAVCAAGFSPEIQGNLDSKLTTTFAALAGGGGSSMNAGQVGMVLETLSYNPGTDADQSYSKCIADTMQAVLAVSEAANSAASGRDIIDSSLLADPLQVMRSGDRFTMAIGESRAVSTETLLFALHTVDIYNGRNYVGLNIADLAAGRSDSVETYQSQVLKLNDRCSVSPYAFNLEKKTASFLVYCAD
ncbi:hypothetical protein [Maliponia aquimaris]|uniref:Uncharacterized protein n=1 Tax=Maliponia aquimaris TaxID=1673631 RepID=A0A238K728_9RHOB|nr:hypothetical protein [Maliponia aquimaris]SMX38277.1 hypothetical protein MAA8898_01463 [Maliponia aquimaris]